MKIAFLVDAFPRLSQTFILNQITGLMDRGHQVEIFAHVEDKSGTVHPEVVRYNLPAHTHFWNKPARSPLTRIRTFFACLLQNPGRLRLLLRSVNLRKYGKKALSLSLFYDLLPFIQAKEDFDIIHCQFGNLGEQGLFLREIGVTNARVITSFRGYDLTSQVQAKGAGMYRDLFKKGDLFLPVCDSFKTALQDLGCPAARVRVHRSGIDLRKFSFIPKDFSFGGRPVRILTVGRFEEKKGISFALQALARLNREAPELSFRYEVAGDGPLMEALKKETRQLGLEPYVTFSGPKTQAEVIGLLQRADIFLAPHVTAANGDKEGIPNVLKEAMAMGVPVMTTFHSGIPELVEQNRTGFLTAERDIVSLADQLAFLLRNPETLKDVTFSARKRVEQDYNIHLLNDELERIYLSCIGKCSPDGCI